MCVCVLHATHHCSRDYPHPSFQVLKSYEVRGRGRSWGVGRATSSRMSTWVLIIWNLLTFGIFLVGLEPFLVIRTKCHCRLHVLTLSCCAPSVQADAVHLYCHHLIGGLTAQLITSVLRRIGAARCPSTPLATRRLCEACSISRPSGGSFLHTLRPDTQHQPCPLLRAIAGLAAHTAPRTPAPFVRCLAPCHALNTN